MGRRRVTEFILSNIGMVVSSTGEQAGSSWLTTRSRETVEWIIWKVLRDCGPVSFTCENYWLQGGPASVTVGTWWFMQAISKVHDWMQLAMDRIAGEQESWLRTIGNVPAMIPSVGIVGAGMMSGVPMGIYLTVDETRHRN